jgi:ribulose-phosphate 3-epimerase
MLGYRAMVLIAPSILSADFLNLGHEIAAIEKASADQIHIDVMDGHFVPNLTIGPTVINAIKRQVHLPLDVHLMISNPEPFIESYVESGADILTLHAESVLHLDRAIQQIKSYGIKAGVALNPSTHESVLQYVIENCDLILVMSVNPGFGGQHFLPSAIKKIAAIMRMLQYVHNEKCIISVDGGINQKTARACIKAGASCLVSGSYIFTSADYHTAINSLRS